MKRALTAGLALLLLVAFTVSTGYAAREKFGVDARHKTAERVKFKIDEPLCMNTPRTSKPLYSPSPGNGCLSEIVQSIRPSVNQLVTSMFDMMRLPGFASTMLLTLAVKSAVRRGMTATSPVPGSMVHS